MAYGSQLRTLIKRIRDSYLKLMQAILFNSSETGRIFNHDWSGPSARTKRSNFICSFPRISPCHIWLYRMGSRQTAVSAVNIFVGTDGTETEKQLVLRYDKKMYAIPTQKVLKHLT
jgi:hypothetical protein